MDHKGWIGIGRQGWMKGRKWMEWRGRRRERKRDYWSNKERSRYNSLKVKNVKSKNIKKTMEREKWNEMEENERKEG